MQLKFADSDEIYDIPNGFKVLTDTRICIYNPLLPEKTCGFDIITDDGILKFPDHTAVYDKTDEYIIFTSDTTVHYLYYVFNEDGFVVDYMSEISIITDPNIILIGSGIGKEYEAAQVESFVDENNVPTLKVVNNEVVPVTNEDREYLRQKEIQAVKDEKLAELSEICSSNITNGVDYNDEHFSYTLADQNNIYNSVQLANITGLDIPYHADGKDCRLFTKEELVSIYILQEQNLTHNITYHNQLKRYTASLTSIEEIQNIRYGQELTGDYLNTYNASMNQAQQIVAAFIATQQQQ